MNSSSREPSHAADIALESVRFLRLVKAAASVNWAGCEGYEPACVPEHCQCREVVRAILRAADDPAKEVAVLAARLKRHVQSNDWMTRKELVFYYGEYEARQIMKDRAAISSAKPLVSESSRDDH